MHFAHDYLSLDHTSETEILCKAIKCLIIEKNKFKIKNFKQCYNAQSTHKQNLEKYL